LYITDAAVIPPSLGVNPRLTISAQVEGTCAHLARDHGQAIDYTLA
jgi:choline dehydrogenase-like flavoprotein